MFRTNNWKKNLWQPDNSVNRIQFWFWSIAILLASFSAIGFPATAFGQDFDEGDLVEVRSTTFQCGADVSSDVIKQGRIAWSGPDWDEGPVHRVELSAFRIGKQQVTMKQFAAFSPTYRQTLEAQGGTWQDDAPAVFVSWHEASAYCTWLSAKSKKQYRLPTEAQWELAASQTKILNLKGIADGTQEWCHDWWAPYSADPLKDPHGPATGSVRIVRDGGGGSVEENKPDHSYVVDYRISDRSATVPGDRRPNLGFRFVSGELAAVPSAGPSDSEVELVGSPFEDIKQQTADWADSKNNSVALFWAGGKFVQPSADRFASLPYWNRHHVPSLTWCDNGDLLATAFTAPFDNSEQMAILITRLRHGKKKWDAPARFFIAPDHNVTGSTLFNAGDGVIHHYNGLGNNLCEDFSMIKRVSRDNGATWSPPKIVHRFPVEAASPEKPSGSPRLWPHMDLKSYTNANGGRTLFMSTDVGAGNDLGSAIFTSDDEGESWNELTRTGWQSDNHAIEKKQAGWIAGIHAPVERLKDGTLIAIGRSNNIDGFSPLSRSSDSGKSWTYSASPFPAVLSGQRTALMRLAEGPLLYIGFTDSSVNVRAKKIKGMNFIDADGNQVNGSGMFTALSFDEGKTWQNQKLIPNWHKRPWKSRYTGYLSSIQTPDGIVHLVSSKFYYRFNLAWLKEPMPESPDR